MGADSSDSRKSTFRVPTSITSRGLEFLKMGAKLAAKSASGGDRAIRHLEQAQVLLEGLSRLKGAAMKLGQTVSVELRDVLPPEFIDALSKLQDEGTALSGADIREILRKEWGHDPLTHLESFVDSPLASASIGQVHAARWGGRDIALKVQFPGITQTLESDIQGLNVLLRSVLLISGRKVQVEPLVEEIASVFRQETDYLLEATFLKEYRDKIQSFPGYRVPEVISELSTSKVLAMSRERGLKPLDWVRVRQPSAEVRARVGSRILDLYEIEFFQMGLVQTDPNFANFLIDDSDSRENPTITLLDFGAVKRYSLEFRKSYHQLLQLAHAGNRDAVVEKFYELELLNRSEGADGVNALWSLLRSSISPFDPDKQPFRFADADYAREMRESALQLTKACRASLPPRSIIFLHRKLGGVFNLLKAMNVELDLAERWKKLNATLSASGF
ncbi:MAG: AarF/ABC1/UbiB kinase family protein [Bdellovibrionales bacterium]|nr:AarF/ABC1/UbiB kinase family protein [Bdellovibrionales bacterium]